MSAPVIFALARFSGFFDSQPMKLLIFDPEGIRMVTGAEETITFPYSEVEKVQYIHSRTLTPGWMSNLGGFFTRPKEDLFRIRVKEVNYELPLEIDAFHRKGEIREVLTQLYREEVVVVEQTGQGKRTFLMQPITGAELEGAIESLRNSG